MTKVKTRITLDSISNGGSSRWPKTRVWPRIPISKNFFLTKRKKIWLSTEREDRRSCRHRRFPRIRESIRSLFILDLLFLLYCYHFLKTEYLYINHFFFNIIKVSKRHPTKYCISIFQSLNFVRLTSPDLSKTHNSVLFFKF